MNSRAFTLIELIVVLALVSMMLVIALPAVRDTLSAYPVRTEAKKLAECIEETRSRASREQVDFLLSVDIEKGRLWTCRTSESAEPPDRSGNAAWTLPGGVRIAGIRCGGGNIQKTGEARILFSGRNYARPAVIYLLRDGRSVSLTIRPFMSRVEIRSEQIEASEEGHDADEA